jgi:CubicO group peptidase (beta-lactamase class C family)
MEWILGRTFASVVGIALVAVLTPLPTSAQEKSLEAQVDEIFAAWDNPDSAGCAVSAMRDGAIVYKRGYGMANLEYGVPITPSSVFHVASVSKQFTAFALMLLASQGKLSLDDDVRKFVPEVPAFGPTITVRHLIHHTSGLRDQWDLLNMAGWRWQADVVKQEDVLYLTSRQKALNFEPGAEYLYSNTGYTLMAVIVERLSGQTLREFAEENIFEPLGMEDTHFHDDHEMIVRNRAYAYAPASHGGLKISIPDFDVVGATSLFTTVEDLARWDRNFYTGHVGGQALIRQMHERGVLNDGDTIAYAFALSHGTYRGLATVGHGGADAGYRSNFVRFPDQRFTVDVLCNFPSSNPGGKARRVADVYLAGDFTEPPSDPPSMDDAVQLSDAELRRLAGYYRHPASDLALRLFVKDGNLMIGSGEGTRLVYLGEHRFRIGESTNVLEIELSAAHPQIRGRFFGNWEAVYSWAEPATVTAAELGMFVGTYHSDELNIDYAVEFQEGSLVVKNIKTGEQTLTPTYADGFSFPGGSATFTRDATGRIDGFTVSTGRVRKVVFERVGTN